VALTSGDRLVRANRHCTRRAVAQPYVEHSPQAPQFGHIFGGSHAIVTREAQLFDAREDPERMN